MSRRPVSTARRLVALAALPLLAVCEPALPPADTTLGVSQELARLRAETLSDVAYDVRLTVPADRVEPLTGTTRIRFRRSDPGARALVVDFKDPGERVREVRLDGAAVAWQAVEDHIVVAGDLVGDGDRELEVTYEAGDDALNRSDDFLYTLFVPDRAHFSLPVFDQPDLKARFDLELVVPEGWSAVANGPELEAPGGQGGAYRFATTEPLPTYLFAFAAGRFQMEEAERDGRLLRLFHRETDTARVAANREAVFDLVASSLAYMEDYTGIPFPFAKYDLVLLPPFQYGGMEHPGAIFYRQSSLFLEPSATQGAILGRASLIAHETAHLWFGDLVTMRWFDDVWTKEVFANFMAAKMVHPAFPELDHELRFLLAHHPAAYGVDRTQGANAIRQPLENLREAGTLYGPIIYQKAPIVMRHLERVVGEEAFRDGLREYLERHAYANATWPDLIAILDARTPADLASWSRVWVEEPGRPIVFLDLERGTGSVQALRVRQEDPMGRGRLWPQELRLVASYGDSTVQETVALEGSELVLDAWRGRPSPAWILLNGAGLEYGLFHLDDVSLTNLLADVATLEPPLVRGAAWLTLRDALLEGRLQPEAVLTLALEALRAEENEQLVQMLLGLVGDTYWHLLPEARRAALAPGVEAALWSGLEAAPTSTLKSAYLGAARSVSITEASVRRLEGLWSGAESVPGLTLAESDRTELAAALALREVADAESILDRQAEAISNPDRRARFDFVRPALSADPTVREAFFETLRDPANRAREPWVLSALSYLNHPSRQEHARRFVGPALELLEEVQRTGDIFFPGRWVDSVLEGHNHPEAARTVAAFLDARPGYPPRLRAKVLQSADGLWRAASLVHGADGLPPLTADDIPR